MRGKHTTVIGIAGAFGNINFTSSNFCRSLQFSASDTHPAPLSPRPCAMITVAVCFLTAGTMSAVGFPGGMLVVVVVNLREEGLLLGSRLSEDSQRLRLEEDVRKV